MRITDPGMLRRFDGFVKGIAPADRVGLFYDDDPDGVCSGTLVVTALERLDRTVVLRLTSDRGNYGLTDHHVEQFKKHRITKVITCDNAVEETAAVVDRLAKFADVLEIDNHAICGSFKAKNVLMMKPQRYIVDMDYSKYCTSKMAYDLFSRHVDLSDRDWVAVAGSISDIATEPWMDFIRATFKKYRIAMKPDFFKTQIGRVGIYINDAISYDPKNINEAFEAVLKAKTPQALLRSSIKKYHNAVEAEIQKYIKAIEKDGEWHPELQLVFYLVKPKFRIKSALSTILGLKYKHWTVILAAPENGNTTLSARRNDKTVAVNKLFQQVLHGLPNAAGGGHIPAAGGGCRTQDWPLVKDRIIQLLRSGFTGL